MRQSGSPPIREPAGTPRTLAAVAPPNAIVALGATIVAASAGTATAGRAETWNRPAPGPTLRLGPRRSTARPAKDGPIGIVDRGTIAVDVIAARAATTDEARRA